MCNLTSASLAQLARWVESHGLRTPVLVADGAVRFVDHDGQAHAVTTLRAAREALGY